MPGKIRREKQSHFLLRRAPNPLARRGHGLGCFFSAYSFRKMLFMETCIFLTHTKESPRRQGRQRGLLPACLAPTQPCLPCRWPLTGPGRSRPHCQPPAGMCHVLPLSPSRHALLCVWSEQSRRGTTGPSSGGSPGPSSRGVGGQTASV